MQSVSVIVSVYNRLDYLRKALISIKHQSTVPAEVVISDDGSAEPIVDFVKAMAAEFPFKIKLVLQKDLGFRLARCKNNAIRAASGDFLIFWDQDVVGTRAYLETYIKNRRPHVFLVAYPVRLTEEQTRQLSDDDIKKGVFDRLLTNEDIVKIYWQYRKDRFYYYLRRFVLRSETRPKLRGGFFAAFKKDLMRVNGFDENYQGWGNEDDDLGLRLYASGVVGFNPFYDEFPVHLYHPPHHNGGKRVNQQYYTERRQAIKKGDFRAQFGLDNSLGDDPVEILEF